MSYFIMSKIVPDSAEPSVILNNEGSPSTVKQVNAKKHWFFTYNNYDSASILILQKVFNEICFMYCFQEETGESGTPHLQGVISLKKKARFTEFGLMKQIHWEKPKNLKECYLYCSKTDTRTGGIYVLNYELPYCFKLDNFYSWQEDIISLVSKKADDRIVNWYWSTSGCTGKSTFVKHLCMNYSAVLLTKGKYQDICNLIYKSKMTTNNIVVFDLPRNNGNKISYDAIESIKNGMITNMKYETGFICFPSPHVVVFANEPPDLSALSHDRWNVVCIDDDLIEDDD